MSSIGRRVRIRVQWRDHYKETKRTRGTCVTTEMVLNVDLDVGEY